MTETKNHEHDINENAGASRTDHYATRKVSGRPSWLPGTGKVRGVAAPWGVLVLLAVSGGVTKSCPAAVRLRCATARLSGG
jgi:hypothetical protein